MKIVVTGSRDWGPDRYRQVYRALSGLSPHLDQVIVGDARGVDDLAAQCCRVLGIPCLEEEAAWSRFGRSAGPKRNSRMLDHQPDQVWWFHDNFQYSKGTKDCVLQAQRRGIPTKQK